MPALLWSLCCAVALIALGDLRAQVVPAVAVLLGWGVGVVLLPRPTGGPGRVLIAALLLRALLLASPATLSDDLFRYLWEGRAVDLGGNPYLHAPSWSGWPEDPFRALVNHPQIPTIYPPLVMTLFAAIAALFYDPLGIKLVFGLADAGLCWGLATTLEGRRRSTDAAWLYALHPLGAVEAAGSGHIDALALLLLVLAIRAWDRRRDRGALWAALGAGVKLFPALILPTLLRAPSWRRRLAWTALGLGVLLALSAPYWDAGSTGLFALRNYTRHWSFNGSLYALMEAASWRWLGDDLPARRLALGLGAAVVGLAVWRRRDPAEVALWAGGAFVLLSPTVHPWYVLWAWVPALLCGVRSWTVLATLVPLAYVVLGTLDLATSTWHEALWPRLVIYPAFFLALGVESVRRALLPGPSAPQPRPGTPAGPITSGEAPKPSAPP